MKKVFLLSIILYTLLGCKKSISRPNIEFVNDDFKVVLDSFILNTKIYPIQSYDDILISLYKESNDTILTFENVPPFELKDLKSVFKYNNYTLYFYASDSLNKKLKTLIKTNNGYLDVNNLLVNKIEVDPIYSYSYLINGNKIEFRKTPLIWSTDSIK